MPKVTEAHLEARRQQILDASSACFARQGFHQTTMQDICREAELSPGAVYRYFASKEDIIAASCQECQKQSLDFIQAAAQFSDDPLEVLDVMLDGLSWLENPEAQAHMRVNIQLWAEALRSPQVREVFERANFDTWREALAGLMRRGQERGQISRVLDPESVARLLMSAWYGLILQRAFDPEMDVSKYVAVLKAMYRGSFFIGSREESHGQPAASK